MSSRLNEQEYLHGELTSDIHPEYVDGEAYAMAGAGEAHNLIAGNIFCQAARLARGGSCCVFISDMKLMCERGKRVTPQYFADLRPER